jgi:uncharacterized membrane protein YgcG
MVADDRMRVENGYGITKYLSDGETKEIINTVFIPHFKENKFFLGNTRWHSLTRSKS